jgi:hypothetical protein
LIYQLVWKFEIHCATLVYIFCQCKIFSLF